MKLYLKRSKKNIDATAEYDEKNQSVTVLKGSLVSETIAYGGTFRGASAIEKSRAGSVKDCIVVVDTVFKSPSTAANYVTGGSTNGLVTWKTAEGKSLKQYLSEKGSDK